MRKPFNEYFNNKKIKTIKTAIELKNSVIMNEINKSVDYLKKASANNSIEGKKIYDKNKRLLIDLYSFHCKFIKLHTEICLHQILHPTDVFLNGKKIDVKEYITEFKRSARTDYELTIKFLKTEYEFEITEKYENLINSIDELADLFIAIQSNSTTHKLSVAEEMILVMKITNLIYIDKFRNDFLDIDKNFIKFMNGISNEEFNNEI